MSYKQIKEVNMEDLYIVALVEFNSGIAVVFNREPQYRYIIDGDLLYAIDGPFVSCFQYENSNQAFSGRKFTLPMLDGTVTYCVGQWWDKGHGKLSAKLGYKVGNLTIDTVERLKDCYVFSGTSCNADMMNKMISEYEGCIYPYWDYEKIIKFDDMRKYYIKRCRKLEVDKGNLIKQCKRLSEICNRKSNRQPTKRN